MSTETPATGPHSAAWIAQAQISFGVACTAMIVGVIYLPVDPWVRSFLGLGLLFVVSSSLTLAKTLRDMHEAKRVISRVDDVKLSRLLAEHDPFAL